MACTTTGWLALPGSTMSGWALFLNQSSGNDSVRGTSLFRWMVDPLDPV